MIYKGLNRNGMIGDIKTKGGGEIAEVYGGIGESNPIFYSRKALTGTSPLTFKGLGQPLKDYHIFGETVQNGTPSPDYPVEVQGVWEKTENLWDGKSYGYTIMAMTGMISTWGAPRYCIFIPVENGKTYTVSRKKGESTFLFYGFTYEIPKPGLYCNPYGQFNEETTVFSVTNTNHKYLVVFFGAGMSTDIMIVEGSTAPSSYIPYGYKIPLTVNGTEYPIYLGQVPTTRRIKKLVLTGQENITTSLLNIYRAEIEIERGKSGMTTPLISTHYRYDYGFISGTAYVGDQYTNKLYINDNAHASTVANFKSYLAAQYAAGTPVTIWYVLEEPETAVVNEPLMKIGGYADTISVAQASVTIPTIAGANTLAVGTTVPPSAVSITGNIKPTGYGRLLDVNDTDIQDKNNEPIFIHE